MPESAAGQPGHAADAGARYAAFLSYAHADEEFGDWLHKRLEAYEVPAPPAGSRAPTGVIGRRLGKVFRDRADLSAAYDLGAEIRKALEESAALIVICSPRSVTSRYVNEEIRYFKQLGRGTRIFAAIVDGEPRAARKPGHSAAQECFPPALIYRLGPDGAISSAPEASEPIAADFRPGKDGRENGALKLIAGLLGVGLDELVQRERQAELRRRRRANAIAGAMATLALGAVAAGGVAFWQRNVAQHNEQRARDLLERVFAERSWDAMRRGEHSLAARYALAGWRAAPDKAAEYRAALGAAMHDGAHALPLKAHPSGVSTAAFSRDGKRIVVGYVDFTVRVQDATGGQEIVAFRGHEAKVLGAAFSPDGMRVVTGSADRTARIWDVATGREMAVLRGHEKAVSRVAFNRDGTRVLTTSDDRTAHLWDAADARHVAYLRGQERDVHGAAFSPDGTRVLTTSWEHKARVWDAASGNVWTAAFSRDGTRLLTTSEDGTVRIWDSVNGHAIAVLHKQEDGDVRTTPWDRGRVPAQFSPDGTRVLTSRPDGAYVWHVALGREMAVLRGHGPTVSSVAFSRDSTRIVTASSDGTARVWDAASGREIVSLRMNRFNTTEARAVFSPDGTRIVTASGAERIMDGGRLRPLDGTARVWDAASGEEIAVLRGHADDVRDAAFSPDGTRVVTASEDHTARVWDAVSGRELVVLRRHGRRVWRATFSPDGTRILSASGDGTARVWDAASGRQISVLGKEDNYGGRLPVVAAFSPDGKRALTGSSEGMRVWDASSGKLVAVLGSPRAVIYSAMFSSDGTRILAAAGNNAHVWDVASGREIALLRAHENFVMSADFSPDGTRVVTASWDHTGRVWDAGSGRELSVLRGHDGNLVGAAFSPDGTRIVTASWDQTARIWNARYLTMPMETLAAEACRRFVRSLTDDFRIYLQPRKPKDAVAFSRIEIAADPLIGEVWLRGRDPSADICEGLYADPAAAKQ